MELGARFWLGLVAVTLGIAVAVGIFFLLIGWAWYAWGILGAFVFFGAIALGIAWVVDKRSQKRYADA